MPVSIKETTSAVRDIFRSGGWMLCALFERNKNGRDHVDGTAVYGPGEYSLIITNELGYFDITPLHDGEEFTPTSYETDKWDRDFHIEDDFKFHLSFTIPDGEEWRLRIGALPIDGFNESTTRTVVQIQSLPPPPDAEAAHLIPHTYTTSAEIEYAYVDEELNMIPHDISVNTEYWSWEFDVTTPEMGPNHDPDNQNCDWSHDWMWSDLSFTTIPATSDVFKTCISPSMDIVHGPVPINKIQITFETFFHEFNEALNPMYQDAWTSPATSE